jgi:hypothetical protein
VLEAAHIKPYAVVQRHEISNGLLMRSDLHRLFDGGYMTLDPGDRRVVVSKRIRAEFKNNKEYFKPEGQLVREPSPVWARPTAENLEFHAHNDSASFSGVFRISPTQWAANPRELDLTETLCRFARNAINTLSFRRRPFRRFGLSLSNSLRNSSGVMERYLSVKPNPTCPM